MNRYRKNALILAMGAIALTGCGPQIDRQIPATPQTYQEVRRPATPTPAPQTRTTTPTKTTPTKTTKTATSAPVPSAAPAQQPRLTPSASKAWAWLDAAKTRFESMQNFQALVTSFSKKGSKTQLATAQYTFAKPYRSLTVVTESDDPSSKGVKMYYEGGTEAKVRPSGVLSLVSVTLPTSDSRLLNARGYKMEDTTMTRTIGRVQNPKTQVEIAGKSQIDGRDTIMVKVIPPERLDPDITVEYIGIDVENKMPAVHEMYVGQELVFQLKMKNVVLDSALPANAFDL